MSRSAVPPPACHPGDRVGIAALSGPVDPQALEAGADSLRALGFEPVPATNCCDRAGLFAGEDERRLASFCELAADPDLAAIVFARGGHGVMRLLPRFDWGLLAKRPRAYVGYSDLTPFLLEVVKRLGIWSFHGPMVGVDLARGLDDVEQASLLAALAGRCDLPGELDLLHQSSQEVRVEGTLLGGCLSLLCSTLGTPFETSFRDCLVFVEDVGEPLYRRDRLLTHLGLSGSLIGARGLLTGQFVEARDAGGPGPIVGSDDEELRIVEHDWRAILRDFGRRHALDVLTNLQAGHGRPNLTLPLGARISVDLTTGHITLARRGGESS